MRLFQALAPVTPWQEVAILAACLSAYALLVMLGVTALKRRHAQIFSGVSASIFSPLGAIFGLTATFLGADVWENDAAALRAVNDEARALSEVRVLSRSLPPEVARLVQADIDAYSRIVLTREWPILDSIKGPHNPVSEDARNVLYDILRQVANDKVTDGAGLVPFEIEDLVRQIFISRTQRIVIAIHHVSASKLYLTLSLGLLLILAVAVVHSASPGLLVVMTMGATLVVGLVVCGVLANDEPFEPDGGIRPGQFYRVDPNDTPGPAVTAPPVPARP